MRGRKPKPTAVRRADGNPGKRRYNPDEPVLAAGSPDCPAHLNDAAREEWHRLVGTLVKAGIVTLADRAALAAYCQAWGRWVEAEEKLKETPVMFRTPSGYVQQSPWLSVSNKQVELMGRFMAELGITPASRSRVAALATETFEPVKKIEFVVVYEDKDGNRFERPLDGSGPAVPSPQEDDTVAARSRHLLDSRL